MTIALEQVFAEALGIDIGSVNDGLAYNSIPQWDSVAHMGLIAQLEDHYGVLLDTDDIIDMSSVAKAREILAKYGIAF
ncbi:acyl carrier protein [Aeromonas sobria]|jgi:acyl carrier protein|uniref:acyl carrier protein n=1 Tax=Aeromonas sobria TaxID=646 RepID=UPI000C6CE050|nr:acyl carrier protein [Aeromonas sobria]EKP0261925.1 acyl carrier protein [Aeromonas sobria]PKQ74965.1 acyl carrier protein [Aeromonas sobria]